MDFEDEEYVRLYVRDTVTWKLLTWEGRAVLMFMLRSGFNRSGIFLMSQNVTDSHNRSQNVTDSHNRSQNVTEYADMPALNRAVAAVTELPFHVVEVGLQQVIAEGVWVINERGMVWPGYVHAQTCSRTDRARKKLERQRKALEAATRPLLTDVTKRDALSQNVPRARVPAGASLRARPCARQLQLLQDPISSLEQPDGTERSEDLPDRSGSPDSSDDLGTQDAAAAAGGSGGGGAERSGSRGRIPCPPDLDVAAGAMSLLLKDTCPEAVESVRRKFIAKAMNDPDDRRPLKTWRNALATAINQDAAAEAKRLRRQAAKEAKEQERDDDGSGARKPQVFDAREFR